jgi:hypothetical protein
VREHPGSSLAPYRDTFLALCVSKSLHGCVLQSQLCQADNSKTSQKGMELERQMVQQEVHRFSMPIQLTLNIVSFT